MAKKGKKVTGLWIGPPLTPLEHKFEPYVDKNICRICYFSIELHNFDENINQEGKSVGELQYAPLANDPVNHPSHYTAYKGLEIIDLTEQMNFNRGNAVKYIARAGIKDPTREIEDLEKARWYIDREIKRLKGS